MKDRVQRFQASVLSFSLDHASCPRVVEDAASIYHRFYITERFEGNFFTGRFEGDHGFLKIYADLITGLDSLTQSLGDFAGIHFTGRHAIAKEDPGEPFSEDDFAVCGPEGDRGMLTGTSTAEVASGQDDRILAVDLAFFDVTGFVQ